MANQIVSSALIRVVIGGQVFDLPQEKAQQLLQMVRNWQSIAIPENTFNHNNMPYNGTTLIHG